MGQFVRCWLTGHRIIQNIVDCWYLVSVVENDYIKGDLFRVFNTA